MTRAPVRGTAPPPTSTAARAATLDQPVTASSSRATTDRPSSSSEAIGIATNNVAEYHGLLAALRWAVEHGVGTLQVKADSELMVKQMLGVYRVKNPGLRPLYDDACSLAPAVEAA